MEFIFLKDYNVCTFLKSLVFTEVDLSNYLQQLCFMYLYVLSERSEQATGLDLHLKFTRSYDGLGRYHGLSLGPR